MTNETEMSERAKDNINRTLALINELPSLTEAEKVIVLATISVSLSNIYMAGQIDGLRAARKIAERKL